ncbi:efflux RND transporter permease subunit [Blastopirellula marina]|uniref:AcrB/AcrD/AcrF family protein n=1 Tax=Blastopirellula marina TaxID=124 RepID=A0A2S8FN92_9BACT|nr:efflux RND transporter permease subunit [Blastopirellula marina]PQO33617.1 AcrB/AcrD/AcrF family protein [Blastopirellula marina]PTL43404.1 AcrB/AcrD/AcrF family protein [Blastopirellula marina]
MDPIKFAIENPVKTAVGVILILMFGAIAFARIPVQLTPDVDRPVITIRTTWDGRSPEEIEKSIILEQEEKLKSVQGLWKMTSLASLGRATITLEFNVGASPDRILQEVSNKIDEVPEYPEDVDRPIIDVADTASDEAIAYLLLQAEDPNFDVATFFDYADRFLKPSLERIEGVAEVDIKGGRQHQVQIRFDPKALAKRSITVPELNAALRLDNVNASAGDLANNRQDVRFRVLGQYDSLEPLRDTIIKYDEYGSPIRVADVAHVELALEKSDHFDQSKGKTSMTIFIKRKTGSNVLDIIEKVNVVVDEMNAEGGVLRAFKSDRYGLRLRSAFDDSYYIYSAIGLVRDNLLIGGGLAVLILFLFLRSFLSTMIIAVSIPISIIGTFVVMWFAGRNLNVISLAGLSFAVGMVVDNAIVVLENIDRHRQMGASPLRAAYHGTREVWGAILASTLTTIAVFAPVLTIQDEAGQLFYDLVLAICAAVALSLVVSISVIPMLASLFLSESTEPKGVTKAFSNLFGIAPFFGWLGNAWASLIHLLTFPSLASAWLRVMVITLLMVGSVGLSFMLMPPASYLPNGNKNFTFCRMSTPAGYSIMENYYVGQRIEEELKPFWSAKNSEEASQYGPVVDLRSGQEYHDIPALKEFFFVVARGSVFMIGISDDPNNVQPVAAIFNKAFDVIPASKGVTSQRSIFGRGAGSSNAVEIEVSSNDMTRLKAACSYLEGELQQEFSRFSVRTSPENFNESGPEQQLRIKQEVAKRLNISVSDLAISARSMIDGSFVGDFDFEGDNIDLVLIRDPASTISPEDVAELPIAVKEADGSVVMVSLGQIAEFLPSEASQEIRRVEQQRAISLTVTPPNEVALEDAQARILEIVAQARTEGKMGNDIFVSLSGNADRLSEVRSTLMGQWTGWNWPSLGSVAMSRFFLALVITYLLMAALFENFIHPFVIMFTVPLATIGGFFGLWLVHQQDPTQQMDVLTMLGFVILVGVVVNNAILIVHQALNFMRGEQDEEGNDIPPMPPREAIRESVRTRMRPIFITTFTSVFGMLPLVIAPGSGSELYRGLGAIVVGGLVFATIFTLLVIPLLFSLVMDVITWWKRPEATADQGATL